MLADMKLYWDPKSNLLFFPEYETEPVEGDDRKMTFELRKYRPCSGCGLDGYPWFEAVKIASFGTWGIMGWDEESIIYSLLKSVNTTSKADEFYEKHAVNVLLRKFVKANPSFKRVRFAKKKELSSGVPKAARIRKPAKRVKP